jgi:hypothetical protein
MKITSIINEDRSYLYEGLSKSDTQLVKLWENAGNVLKEYAMTPDQINKLFQTVEKNATTAGDNRTLLGRGKDAASAVNQAWETLKDKVQNSGPVKNIDAMYDTAAEKLKQATGGDQGVMTYVQKYRDFAKAHPIAQSLIYSALIAAAGISGAGLGSPGLPFPLLALAPLLPGTSPERSTINTIQLLQGIGIPTGALPDGSPNLMLLNLFASHKGVDQENSENGKVDGFVIVPPLLGGIVKISAKAY